MILDTHLHEACCDLVADCARTTGKVHIKVAGTSMVPTIWPGDTVFVRHCEPSELQPNSVIMFRQNRGLVVHRVIRRTTNQIVTRGDAKRCLDEPVNAADIVGQVEAITRKGRSINPQGSLGNRAVAFLLRHSEWCAWLFLRLSFKLRRMQAAEAA